MDSVRHYSVGIERYARFGLTRRPVAPQRVHVSIPMVCAAEDETPFYQFTVRSDVEGTQTVQLRTRCY